MALRRIAHRRRPLLAAPRAFFSSNPPFPPPPPPPATDSDAAHPPSSPPPGPGAQQNPTSVLFADIRERLRSSSNSPPPRRIPMNPPRPNPEGGPTPTRPPLDDIRRMLGNFRATGGAPSPPGTFPSFSDLIKGRPLNAGKSPPNLGIGTIRESLKGLPQQRPPRLPQPFLSPASPIFNKELDRNAKAGGQGKEEDKNAAFTLTRDYTYEDLGKRLEELRPPGAGKDGKDWFSLEELQGRISKLVELEKQTSKLAAPLAEVRESISSLTKPQKQHWFGSTQSLLTLGQTLEYLRLPPQEELVERYFHPDHMSSEEKMKLELQRVRDEFKMSENDCGSARVQIAQLTLKIKHLSAVLHKKDKHSRKGLQEMVQRRKKYLKYLRRTDWDSYCLVLSKLGLRDVPEYKAPDYKSKPTTKAKSKKSRSKSKKKRKMKA